MIDAGTVGMLNILDVYAYAIMHIQNTASQMVLQLLNRCQRQVNIS